MSSRTHSFSPKSNNQRLFPLVSQLAIQRLCCKAQANLLFYSQHQVSHASSSTQNYSENWSIPSSGRRLKAERAILGYYSAMYLKVSERISRQCLLWVAWNFYLVTKQNNHIVPLESSSPQCLEFLRHCLHTCCSYFLACSPSSSSPHRLSKHLKNPRKKSNSLGNLFWPLFGE